MSVSQKVPDTLAVVAYHIVERKRMTFSPSARPQQATGTKQHQMRVTHSALGLHAGQPPDRSEASMPSSRGWPLGTRLEVAPAERNGAEQRAGNQFGGLEPEKGLSMRRFRPVPIARGFTSGNRVADTVEAEKGTPMPEHRHAA